MRIEDIDFKKLMNIDVDAEIKRRATKEAKCSLEAYVKACWHVLEPDTDLSWNWHLSLMCEYLEAVTEGKIKRLIINVPPRSLKSIIVTIMWPTWEWITRPGERYIFSSYSQSLSLNHSIARRRLMQDKFYEENFASFSFTTDQNVKSEYENDKRGMMVATSTGGTITGKGGNRIIIDDTHPRGRVVMVVKPNGDQYLLVGDCNRCGRCCEDVGKNKNFIHSEGGKCKFFKYETVNGKKLGTCKIMWERPVACYLYPRNPDEKLYPECGFRWDKVE